MPEGLVLWGVKNIYYVLDRTTGIEYKCVLKGKVLDTDFKTKGRSESNPVVAGDEVFFNFTDNNSGIIFERKKRRNEYKRIKGGGRIVQTVFANIDYLLIVDSIENPPMRPFFIDRCLFTAEYMNIEPVIIFNKADLLNDENNDLYKKSVSVYQNLKYKVIELSVINKKGVGPFKSLIKGKIASMHGRSGVGKSSIIKILDPRFDDIKIGEINKKYDRGVHTTTFSKIYILNEDTMLMDTPGIRELSVYVDKPELVEGFFRDFAPYRSSCRFSGCQHISEPGCKVLEELKNNHIDASRYESYLRIRETVNKIDDSVIY